MSVRLAVLVLCMVAFSACGNAMDWQLSAGLNAEVGEYNYSTGVFDFSVAKPTLVYTIEAKAAPSWIFSASYATSETQNASMDQAFYDLGDWTDKFQGTPYGHTTEITATLGRCLDIGEAQLIPNLGYKECSFAAGASQISDTNQLTRHTFGLTAHGLRIGLKLQADIGSRLGLVFSGGITPALTVGELRYIYEGETPSVPGTKETYDIRYPHDQQSSEIDCGISLNYQLSPSLSLAMRYRYEFANADFVKLADATGHGYCMADNWKYESTAAQIGVQYRF